MLGNLVVGLVFVIGGLSGELVLVGTDSSMALVVIGFGMIAYTLCKAFAPGLLESGSGRSSRIMQETKMTLREME